ncbi:hypothetical protein R5R35_002894 [Gryllus longicercus]|uniref:Uncharacterized protein n=1 Tax=Gryllus longicercus TaxID=2509291 RepID=A0AAN9VBZ0_9ORTH
MICYSAPQLDRPPCARPVANFYLAAFRLTCSPLPRLLPLPSFTDPGRPATPRPAPPRPASLPGHTLRRNEIRYANRLNRKERDPGAPGMRSGRGGAGGAALPAANSAHGIGSAAPPPPSRAGPCTDF